MKFVSFALPGGAMSTEYSVVIQNPITKKSFEFTRFQFLTLAELEKMKLETVYPNFTIKIEVVQSKS